MPRKGAAVEKPQPASKPPTPPSPPPTPPPAAEPPKKRKFRQKAATGLKSVAVWVGENPRPKHWFDSRAEALEFLSKGGIKPTDKTIFFAELKPVTMQFTVNVGE